MNELQSLNADEATDRFYELMKILIGYVPKIGAATFGFSCWYSPELIRLIKSKFVARQLYTDTKDKGHDITYAYATFSNLRKTVKTLTALCDEKYVRNIEEKLPSNTKCFFSSYTKSLKASNSMPNVVQSNGVFTNSRRSACNMFAEYFASVHPKPDSERIFKTRSDKEFSMPTVTSSGVRSVL